MDKRLKQLAGRKLCILDQQQFRVQNIDEFAETAGDIVSGYFEHGTEAEEVEAKPGRRANA
jgi:hypothetical protein